MHLASFKGTYPGWRGLFNRVVRFWLKSPYSHNELVFSDGVCASSTWSEGGVVMRVKALPPDEWDIVPIHGDEDAARRWFIEHLDEPYDVFGLFGFVFPRALQSRKRWFCSEAIAEAVGIADSFRQDPAILPVTVVQRSTLF